MTGSRNFYVSPWYEQSCFLSSNLYEIVTQLDKSSQQTVTEYLFRYYKILIVLTRKHALTYLKQSSSKQKQEGLYQGQAHKTPTAL